MKKNASHNLYVYIKFPHDKRHNYFERVYMYVYYRCGLPFLFHHPSTRARLLLAIRNRTIARDAQYSRREINAADRASGSCYWESARARGLSLFSAARE